MQVRDRVQKSLPVLRNIVSRFQSLVVLGSSDHDLVLCSCCRNHDRDGRILRPQCKSHYRSRDCEKKHHSLWMIGLSAKQIVGQNHPRWFERFLLAVVAAFDVQRSETFGFVPAFAGCPFRIVSHRSGMRSK